MWPGREAGVAQVSQVSQEPLPTLSSWVITPLPSLTSPLVSPYTFEVSGVTGLCCRWPVHPQVTAKETEGGGWAELTGQMGRRVLQVPPQANLAAKTFLLRAELHPPK